MKTLLSIFFTVLITSCSQENKIITNNSIGSYKLNHTLKDKNYDTQVFDITEDTNDVITSIIVRSNSYKTSEGFGVGTSFKELKKGAKKSTSKELNLNKGTVVIGSIGNAIIYDKILFVDTNNDDITDFVWITTKS